MYFTGLKNPKVHAYVEAAEPADRERIYAIGNSILFVHDIVRGLPVYFNSCDVLYTEVAWRAGLEVYNRLAGANTAYPDYVAAIGRIARESGKPTIIVGSRQLEKVFYPEAFTSFEATMNGGDVVVFQFRMETCFAPTTEQLLERLAERYNCIGDFCCGLGRSGRTFLRRGKNFVMSDINAKCIRRIYDELGGE